MEKIDGTSSHIKWNDGNLTFFSGGAKHEEFLKIFDQEKLKEYFESKDVNMTIYGEAYGGKMQGRSSTYGKQLKFVAFEVNIGGHWLDVPSAESIVLEAGLEFVWYMKIPTTLEAINEQRDAPSIQAMRNGCGTDKMREGIVLRPLTELMKNNGDRIIAKHKREEFSEVKTPRNIDEKLMKVIADANKIAYEWVTPMRLQHILQDFPDDVSVEKTGDICKAMIADIQREGEGEIDWTESKQIHKEVSRKTALMFKKYLQDKLQNV